MRKKSVHIIGTRGYPSFYGGFETLVRYLAPYLVDKEWDVTVYERGRSVDTADAAKGDTRVRTVRTAGVETKSLSTLSFGLTSTASAAVKKPDVALVMNVANGFWLPLLRARRIPALVNVDGIEWEREKWSEPARKLFHSGAKATARHADGLVFDSVALGKRWTSEFCRTGTFIPYGASPAQGRGAVDGLSPGNYVLMVARFVPENTVVEFFEAAKEISKNWDVVIVGSAGYGSGIEEELKQIVRANPRIKWFGHVSDDERLFALWENCGLYFHGHSVGGTNPALVQAMALGAPTLARDTVFNREVLRGSGQYTAPNPDAIYKDVSRLMSSPALRQSMSEAAKSRASDAYSWRLVCERYDQSLSALVETRKDG